MSIMNQDVVIIGAGVIGAAIAREISKYELNVCVIEKEEDVDSLPKYHIFSFIGNFFYCKCCKKRIWQYFNRKKYWITSTYVPLLLR